MLVKNIFSGLPKSPLVEEILEKLVDSKSVRIERIISEGHSSPKGLWYDQDKDEWVVLLTGSAGLLFEGSDEVIVLLPGDWINIPAHVKHRVDWTDPTEKTIWLAVHYR